MADNINALILPIGADPSQFDKSISDVKKAYKSLKQEIDKTPFNLVKPEQIEQLKGLERTFEQLQGTVNKTNFNQFNNSSKDARTALNSLSLVAQDAPFGFIGIQNNLPGVIQSFGNLTTESGGLKGALSSIGASLVGPAGLFLAFSAVTAAITFAVQKYGSLGAAINAITGNTNEFTEAISKASKSLTEYNKSAKSTIEVRNDSIGSIENEIIKVNALADVLRTSTTTDRQKQGALAELKKSNDEYFGKLNAQKIDIDLLNESVGKYTESLIKNKVAQNLASEAAGIFTEFLKQNQIAFDISEKINKAFKDVPTLTKQLEDYTKKRDNLIAKGEITSIRFIPISKELAQYFTLNEQLKEVNTNVKSTANSYGILKTQADLAFKAASGFLDLEKERKKGGAGKGKIPGLGEIIEGTQGEGIITTNLALFERYIQGQVRINNAGVDEMVRYRREQLNALDLIPKKVEKEVGTLGLSLPFGHEAQKNLQEYYLGLFEIEGIYQRFKDAQMSGANEFARLQEQIKQFNTLKDSIENNLTRPFRDFFDELLENGKVSFDGFVQLAKDAFKRILAQALASGIANLIAAALSGGGTLALGKLGAAKGIAGTLSGLGKIGGLFGSANFGGVQAGPMQMAGAVNLTLRGSDLVGSINRTNATINRIG